MRRLILLCVLMLFPGTAHADWLQSSSAHFVVYANDSERNIRAFSQQLERYDAAMAVMTSIKRTPPSPSNRVTVFVVNSENQVRKLYGDGAQYVGGFYVPRAGGSIAIVPRVTASTGTAAFSMIVLLHEYAHHFLTTTSNFPMPRWMSEGGAEFFASASFGADGSVGIGRPALHRAYELFNAKEVTAADLLDPAGYERRAGGSYDAFYGKSWLLYHYLAFSKERSGQMERYIRLLASGKSARDAGLEAFGDFRQLEKELNAYKSRNRMAMLALPAAMLQTGAVEVRTLSAGEAAIMPIRIRSDRGVNEEQARELLLEARAIAAKFPDDPAVLSVLAEAEFDAGNDKEAIAASDGALKSDPAQVNAYIQKGLALFRIARTADDKAAAYKMAMAPFLALNRLESDHPLPLIYFYRSFVYQNRQPSTVAIDVLTRAAELAPFDLGLRMTLAMQNLGTGKRDQARHHLTPVAYAPHGGSLATQAQQVLAHMDSDPEWDGKGITPDPDANDDASRPSDPA